MGTRVKDSLSAKRRVFLTAQWRYLLMLNYEIPAEALLPLVPRGTELDTLDDRAIVSVVGFRFLSARVLGLAVPLHRHFEEVNLRFYVKRVLSSGEVRRAVCFVREVAPRRIISTVARIAYNEPYLTCPMRSVAPAQPVDSPGTVSYHWKTRKGWKGLSATAVGVPVIPPIGSEANFITEHYWGYTNQRDGSVIEYEVSHPPWRVWDVERPLLSAGVAGFYGPPFDAALRADRPPRSALICEGSAVSVYFPRRLGPCDKQPLLRS